ncbi:hypothetical protein [Plantibacter sp. VKM Ac-2876]|uniref:hypothetical protein n=1 Tax=Plantibacter sp. VKM Ac-2876 TaxID=2783826 RepID=UPI00188C07B3|nr:hypothetical protein [Plantibacter sp. VKM Ac-2876]MBF4565418.1 hypothetical protein [Plantibacter sp. VKM Ac-2876]
MGISYSGFDDVQNMLNNQLVESLAEKIASIARERGLTTTESININAEEGVDVEAVRKRAEEILKG